MAECLIVDVHHSKPEHVSDIRKKLENFQERIKSVIVLGDMTLVSDCLGASSLSDAVKHVIESGEITLLFVEAKNMIDSLKIKQFRILTTDDNGGVFYELCRLLLTSIYEWTIESVPSGTWTPVSSHDVKEDVQMFLKNIHSTGDIEILKSPLIPSDKFCYGFSTRSGGVSMTKGMASLNLVFSSKKPDPELFVIENQRRLCEKGGFDLNSIHIARSIHSSSIHVIGKTPPADGYDGLTTNKPGVTLMAPGADCTTIIMADPVHHACAAVHGGWKGALAGVTPAATQAMVNEYGSNIEDIVVVFGPSIGKCCLEFSESDAEKFRAISPDCIIWRDNCPKPFIDLHKAHRILLECVGVLPENIDDETLTLCTLCNPEKCFSYRRDGIPFGNQVGFIALK